MPELLIGVALLLLFVVAGKTLVDGWTTREVGFGVNGIVETRCIDGWKVVVGQSGSVQQLLDDRGGGIRCGEPGSNAKASRATPAEPIPR